MLFSRCMRVRRFRSHNEKRVAMSE
jgi:hypothetical protein